MTLKEKLEEAVNVVRRFVRKRYVEEFLACGGDDHSFHAVRHEGGTELASAMGYLQGAADALGYTVLELLDSEGVRL